MSIRIGSSCALSVPMAIGYAVEARILSDNSSNWKSVCKYAIDNKQFLILNPCVNDGYDKAIIPSDYEWKKTITEACQYLKSIGANYNNCKITIINEPTKHFRNSGGVARYANFINMAFPIVNSYGFRMGAGNMEFYDAAVLGDWYGYICANANFTDLDIHIQASCDNAERTKKYTDYAYGLAVKYKKKLDCTEAFYGNITTSSGWELLQTQLYHAERVGCENFLNVFNNIDTSTFPTIPSKWYELCFKINGAIHSNYWAHWKILMDTKCPIPNIIEEEDLKLEKYYYRLKVTYNRDTTKAGIKFIQTVIGAAVDGKWGTQTDELLKAYQRENDLVDDAIVGPLTFRMMMKTNPNAYIDLQYFVAVGDW